MTRVLTDTGLRVHFRADPGVEQELRELVAVENVCCSWADWRVETNGNEVVLELSSTGDGIAVAQGMVTLDA
jgi:hypothetical protein